MLAEGSACLWGGGGLAGGRWCPHPVELGPGHGHAAVVLQVAAAAVEQLLRQEHKVLLGQAPVALHFGLEFHVERFTQLWPQHFVRHGKWHPALRGTEERGEKRQIEGVGNVHTPTNTHTDIQIPRDRGD